LTLRERADGCGLVRERMGEADRGAMAMHLHTTPQGSAQGSLQGSRPARAADFAGRRRRAACRAAGLSLVEVLIVVVILGILAAVVVPQFGDMISDVRDRVLDINKSQLNRAVQAYYAEHGSFPAGEAEKFRRQLTMASNKAGETDGLSSEEALFGPYLAAIPENPFTGGNTIGMGAPGSSDWYYDTLTGVIEPNHVPTAVAKDARANMRSLLTAALNYANDHGRLPDSLDALQGQYLSPEQYQKVMTNPVTGENPGFTLTGSGLTMGEITNPASTPVMYETWGGSPNYSGIVGYADGRVSAQ
jgi:general secretion pathway protein G